MSERWNVVSIKRSRTGQTSEEVRLYAGPLAGLVFDRPLTWRQCQRPESPPGSLEGVRGERVIVRLEPVA